MKIRKSKSKIKPRFDPYVHFRISLLLVPLNGMMSRWSLNPVLYFFFGMNHPVCPIQVQF